MSKIQNKYRLINRIGMDVWGTLVVQRIKFKRLRGIRLIRSRFETSRIRRDWSNLLLLDRTRGGKFVRRRRPTQYGLFLRFQRKFRSFYGIRRETQLRKFASQALKSRNSFGSQLRLSEFLDMRLDSLLWRARFGKNISSIRQMIAHKKICVNGKIVDKPGSRIKVGDAIHFLKFKQKEKQISPEFSSTLKRRVLIQTNFFKYWNRWTPPIPNFIDVDYKNFTIIVNSTPSKADLFYPFSGSLKQLLWYYGLRF